MAPPRRLRVRSLTVGLASVLAVVGCGGGDGGDGTGATRTETVTVVSQNLLHGLACPPGTERCRLAARVDLFGRQLEDAGCPGVVGVQEADPEVVRHLRRLARDRCGGRYRLVGDGDPGSDREVVLTTGRVVAHRRFRLAGPLRTALWARLATPVGLVDLWVAHLASSSDDRPCDERTCPPPCRPADRLNTCQARQVADLLDEHRHPRAVAVVAGDLNATPGEPTLEVFRALGFLDTHRWAGNPECDPDTGTQCTSGRIDDTLADLTDPASRQSERIDYVLLAPGRRCRPGTPTGLFAPEPAERPEAGLVFASDHTGVVATLRCLTTADDRAAARRAAARASTGRAAATTTTRPPLADARAQAVQAAFDTVFAGSQRPVGERIAALEDPEGLREVFLARFGAVADLAARVTVRIDQVRPAGPDRTEVTFTLLLDGTPVLDQLPGEAVLVDGTWRVSTATFCEVATLGTDEVPAACARRP